ncbi:response regulator [Pseudanabaena sp. 'Roaring Creek']|uniref:response regulator n=1 Tax=Pseudanabaena sp. 'Roaring Creek' TaxID=1681830 RepID=UPI0006D7D98F|nr:response regulator [Pseudanabaena sp. 'Roaring Creek']
MTYQISPPAINILIVDDSESDRATYLRYLQLDPELLCNCIEAESLEEGLNLWRSQKPDIMLIDIRLPDGDGLEFLEIIHQEETGEKTPAIILTGQGDEKLAVRAMKLGASDYLIKGELTAKSLVIVIKQVLRQTVLSRRLQRSQKQQILVSEIALRVREFLNLDDISNTIVREVRQFLGADRVVVYKFQPDMGGVVVAEDVVTPWRSSLEVRIDDTCFQENLGGDYCKGKIFAASDIYAANLTDCHIQLLERFQVRANLVVPILLSKLKERTLWGLLVVHQCGAPRIWEESDIQLVQQLSIHLEIAIQQAISYQQVQNELAERKRFEDLLLRQQVELEERNKLLEVTSEELQCTIEELRVTTEDLISQHRQREYAQIRYQNLFDVAPDGYLVTDKSGQILEANQVVLELLEIHYSDILGSFLDDFIIQREFFYSQLSYLVSRDYEKTTWEITMKSFQSNLFPAEITATKNINPADKELQLCWIIRDISDRKLAEQVLQQLNQSLEIKVQERTQELSQVNKLQRAILDGTDYAIISTDLNGIIQTFNAGAEKMFGYRMEEVVGRATPEIFHDREEILAKATRATAVLGQDMGTGFTALISMAMQGLIDEEWIDIRKDGSRFPVSMAMTVLKDDSDQPIGTLSIRQDISDRKQAELRLKHQALQKQVLLHIIQAIRQPLNVLNILNIAVQELRLALDLDRAAIYRFQSDWNGEFIVESVADGWVKLVDDNLHKVWEDTYLQETQGGRFANYENMIVTDIYEEGLQPCHIELLEQFQARAYAIAPIFVSGNLWGLLGMYQNDRPYVWQEWEIDLLEQIADQVAIAIQQSHLYEQIQTELLIRKQTEAQIRKANEELLRATKMKDEFLANMSHELRTPLNSILGLSEALGEQVFGLMNEKQVKAINTVASSGEHLLSLINDILDLSKISSGMMEIHIEPVSVRNLCESSLVFIRQQAHYKGVRVFSEIPENIHNINVEQRRIKQVLINLLTNAVKFTPNEGKVSLLVAFGQDERWQGSATIPQSVREMNAPMILFQIVDTGIGISPHDLTRIFQPFVQISSSLNRRYEGTGLGLALVKQITEMHGGRVFVESEVGKGSCFTVALPYEIYQSDALDATASLTNASFPQYPNRENAIAPLVLLAEDNEANIQTFSSYLLALKYRLAIAKNGKEAVAMTQEHCPDIIIMDIQMPEMDGLEAIRLIRNDPKFAATPIIALTALAMEVDRERCLKAGANEYLSKPIKLKKLHTTIQQIFQQT